MLQLCENFVTAEWFPTKMDDVTGFSCESKQRCGHCVTWLDVLHCVGVSFCWKVLSLSPVKQVELDICYCHDESAGSSLHSRHF